MKPKKIIVLGAGIAGLSAAWHLKQSGVECLVLEKEPQLGGLCRSKNKGGFIFDYDGHLMHFRHEYTFSLIRRLLSDNLQRHTRSAWIYYDGYYSRYPFQANLYGLPAPVIKECLLGFINAQRNGRLNTEKTHTFFNWIKSTFGDGIATHFMVPYNAKFWTVAPQELTCDWLDGFIPIPKLSHVIDGTIEESKRQFGYNRHFWYPKEGGISRLPEAFGRDIENIKTSCSVTEIDLKRKTLKTSEGAAFSYEQLISTVALPELPNIINGLTMREISSIKRLRWNSIFNINIGIQSKMPLKNHWVYFPQKKLSFFRVGFAHNFSKSNAPKGMGSLYAEVSYSRSKPIDKKRIVGRVLDDLINIGIIKREDNICEEDINDINYGYPIYDFNCAATRERILNFLRRNNIVSCGRYGSWKYFSMEDSILDGRRAAQEIMRNA